MLSPSETQRFGRKSESNIRSPRFGKWEMRRGTSFWECEFREPRLLDHASEGLLENGKEQELEWGYGVWVRVTTREVGMWKESQETHGSKFIFRSDRQFSGATLRPHPAAVNNAQLWRRSRAAVCCPRWTERSVAEPTTTEATIYWPRRRKRHFVRATLLFGSQRAMSVGLRYPIPVGHCQ